MMARCHRLSSKKMIEFLIFKMVNHLSNEYDKKDEGVKLHMNKSFIVKPRQGEAGVPKFLRVLQWIHRRIQSRCLMHRSVSVRFFQIVPGLLSRVHHVLAQLDELVSRRCVLGT